MQRERINAGDFAMLDIPENAIKCFEKWSRTSVTVFDFSTFFSPTLPQSRNWHLHRSCELAKLADNSRQCVQIDRQTMKQEIWHYRQGCLKICHRNLLEWVVPVYSQEKLLCILEAGIRRPKPGAVYDIPTFQVPADPPGILCPEVPEVDVEEARMVMEGLRQLAARLHLWYEDYHKEQSEHNTTREVMLHRFFKKHCRESLSLQMLAQELHLSPSRTAHVVKEITGKNFKEIVTEYRMRYICLLLQTTTLTIAEIGAACGFTDLTHFHRLFRNRMHMTPRRYRLLYNADQSEEGMKQQTAALKLQEMEMEIGG